MFRKFALAAALLTGTTNAGATPPVVPPPGAISADTMREVTRVLSSDAFEGRAPGTPGEEKTLTYIVERFAAAGLEPGNQGSWFQDVPLVEITGRNFSPLRIGGGAQDLQFAHGSDFVGVSYRPKRRIEIKDSELVFVGYGIVAPEKGWNDYAGVDMRGKTAVILINDPDYSAQSLNGPFNGRAMTYYGRWTYKFEEAAKQGAAAALIVHDTFPAAYGWNVVESSWSGPQVYARDRGTGTQPTKLNGWVQKKVAEEIFAAAGKNLAGLTGAAGRPGFRAVPLGLRASADFANDIRHFASKNVVGRLPGRERPDEAVLYTAHWDHLGRCKPDAEGDDICNGAIDNAAGVAALVALAEAHRKAGAAARSLLFIALTAEEAGLLGSDYYAANPIVPLDRTVGGINMDALSLAGPARNVTVIGGGKSELDAYLDAALAATGRVKTAEPTPEKGYYYRSDHFSFAKRGVPMLYVEAGEDLLAGGRDAGAAWNQGYTEHRYHGPNDEYDPNWEWSGAVADVGLYYRIGRMLAESAAWPNWRPGDEFRALRDTSCAANAGGC